MSATLDANEGDSLIREAGLRVTRQRQAIARVLIEAEDHPDAEQVLERARRLDASVSQATAYRTLAVLSEKGLVRTHTFDGGVMRFELAGRLRSSASSVGSRKSMATRSLRTGLNYTVARLDRVQAVAAPRERDLPGRREPPGGATCRTGDRPCGPGCPPRNGSSVRIANIAPIKNVALRANG